MRGRLALIRRLPPKVVMRRAVGLVGRIAGTAIRRQRDRQRETYCNDAPAGELPRLIGVVPLEALRAEGSWIVPAAEFYRRHHFDLLGSGWLEIAHGMACSGVEGHRYPSAPLVEADRDGNWLAGRINPANLATSRRIWRQTDTGYRPIDWHLDFKSGYRWRESQWATDTPIGHLPGVDVKLPWELSRMQHLAVLAWAFALARTGHAGLAPESWYLVAFRNQVLDFVAANPPRFGINWRCTMDVAIRAANWVVAHDLFRSFGARFDDAFTAILKASLVDHGRHIVEHLEFYPEGRGNHYLANIAGLAFVAAGLPRSDETDCWLAFAAQELGAETDYQFGADGANFEASTSYHRVAAEMVVFASAILAGLPADKRDALANAKRAALHTRPSRHLVGKPTLEPQHFARLALMAEFSRAVTKPGGRVAQIGDNDSGRFFKLHPIFAVRNAAEARLFYANLDGYRGLTEDSVYLDEEGLDHRPLIAAIGTLIDRRDLIAFAGGHWLDAAVVAALCGGRCGVADTMMVNEATRQRTRGHASPRVVPPLSGPERTVEIVAAGSDLRSGMRLEGFAEFGLWIFRSDRIFLAIRCGSIGHAGRGAHAHNDQLSVELAIDGEDWIADPGSYLYTPSRRLRNAYRSVQAHYAPTYGRREPGRLDLGDFWLGDEAQARCLAFDGNGFVGEHMGFGQPIRRTITVSATSILIRDQGIPVVADVIRCVGRRALAARFPLAVPFSPGYGKRYRHPAPARE